LRAHATNGIAKDQMAKCRMRNLRLDKFPDIEMLISATRK